MPHSVDALTHFEQEYPSFHLLADLKLLIQTKPELERIKWIININNNLAPDFRNDKSLTLWRSFHNLLADILFTLTPSDKLDTKSRFIRDCILLKQHHFLSFPLIRKHAMPLENLAMFKIKYYEEDEIFNNLLLIPEEVSSPLSSPTLNTSDYTRDPNFQLIVDYYSKRKSNKVFAGISYEKGGISTVLQIIIEQEAQLRFSGSLDRFENTHLGKTESAYSHGPIFMVSEHFHRTESELTSIKLDDLIFIVPNLDMRASLLNLMNKANSYGLLTPDDIANVVSKILSYSEYNAHYCQTAADDETPLERSCSDSNRTTSELLEGSPPLSGYVQSPNRVGFFPMPPDALESKSKPKSDNPLQP